MKKFFLFPANSRFSLFIGVFLGDQRLQPGTGRKHGGAGTGEWIALVCAVLALRDRIRNNPLPLLLAGIIPSLIFR